VGAVARQASQALEPQAFRALTALLQHLVGGTDNLSTALIGCRIMRAVYSRGDPTLQYLVRSHGALRWAQRLSSTKDVAQCGLYRQLHHEKVTPEDLSREAKALYDELCQGAEAEGAALAGDSEEWKVNARPLAGGRGGTAQVPFKGCLPSDSMFLPDGSGVLRRVSRVVPPNPRRGAPPRDHHRAGQARGGRAGGGRDRQRRPPRLPGAAQEDGEGHPGTPKSTLPNHRSPSTC